MSLLEAVRELGALSEAGEASVAESLLKSLSVASESEAFSTILEDSKIFTSEQGLTINGLKLSEFEKLVREGSLVKLGKALKSTAVVDKGAEESFGKLVGEKTPDRELADLEDAIRAQRNININLNIRATTAQELESQLDAPARLKLSKVWSRLKKVAGTTGKISLIFGFLYIGKNIASCIVDYMNGCNGCFLVTKQPDGTITSCRVRSKMCGDTHSGSFDDECTHDALEAVKHSNVNPLLFLLESVTCNDVKALDQVKTLLRLPKDFAINTGNAFSLLQDAKFANAVERVMVASLKNKQVTENPCGKLKTYTGKCICCDPCAPKNSAEYVSVATLPVECSLKCVRDTRVVDVLVQLSEKLKEDFLEGTERVMRVLRWVLYFFVLVVVLISVTFLARFSLIARNFFTLLTTSNT